MCIYIYIYTCIYIYIYIYMYRERYVYMGKWDLNSQRARGSEHKPWFWDLRPSI